MEVINSIQAAKDNHGAKALEFGAEAEAAALAAFVPASKSPGADGEAAPAVVEGEEKAPSASSEKSEPQGGAFHVEVSKGS